MAGIPIERYRVLNPASDPAPTLDELGPEQGARIIVDVAEPHPSRAQQEKERCEEERVKTQYAISHQAVDHYIHAPDTWTPAMEQLCAGLAKRRSEALQRAFDGLREIVEKREPYHASATTVLADWLVQNAHSLLPLLQVFAAVNQPKETSNADTQSHNER